MRDIYLYEVISIKSTLKCEFVFVIDEYIHVFFKPVILLITKVGNCHEFFLNNCNKIIYYMLSAVYTWRLSLYPKKVYL